MKTQVLVFICEDNEDFFAAVSPSNPYDIFLGKAFWSAPRSGTDSKAGTIIHELSHFNILGGTVDNVYGQSAARSLARNNPSSAINNADNHEYFAENTPLLSMPTAEVPVKPEPEPESGKSPLIIAIIKFLLVGGD
ncbi:MAG: peptidyl-Lys metalloendopeptidase [Chitinophagales bacterium]